MIKSLLTFKRQFHKMVKHTQNSLSADFVGLAHKGLIYSYFYSIQVFRDVIFYIRFW